MDNETRRLWLTASVWELIAEVCGATARMHAMSAANVSRAAAGEAPEYHAESFFGLEEDFKTLAGRLRHLQEVVNES